MVGKDVIEVRVEAKTSTAPAQISFRTMGASHLIAAPTEHTVAAYSKDCMDDPSGTIRPVLSGRIGWVWERREVTENAG